MQTFQLGLIGHPLGHSLSPKIHAAALKACGLQGGYSLFSIHPDDTQGLKDLLARVRAGELHGLNVTIPHKQNVISLLDELTPTAQAIGAVNTIYRCGTKLIGENTDAPGFLSDLKRFLTLECDSLLSHRQDQAPALQKKVLIWGAGGVARAVVYALLNDGWQITVAARRIEQAQQLADSFPHSQFPITIFTNLQPSTSNLIVNATPLGMTPNIETSPLPENIIFSSRTIIYDLVYNPRETKLVKDARAQGLSATTGLGMLVEQAALAFEIWTGYNPPRDVLWNATGN